MTKKLIADAGSTKVDWVVVSEEGDVMASHTCDGINALLSCPEDIYNALRTVKGQLGDTSAISEIHYYGAGCATTMICRKMKDAISNSWPGADVFVSSDLLGAARALLGPEKGIACILGTGSNSGLYDGSRIVSNVPSLGFILGDEGSGAALGKRLVSDAFKGQLPGNISEKFLETYQLSLPEILDKVYRRGTPNKFFASLVPFISQHLWNPYVYSLVLEELTLFIRRNVAMYEGAHSLPVCFIGSIALNFEKILREAAASQGYNVTSVSRSPIDGLIRFHSSSGK